MPIKFKKSVRARPRNSFGKNTVVKSGYKKMIHHYLKCESTKTIIDAINADRTKPKHRAKFLNELTRRGVVLIWK